MEGVFDKTHVKAWSPGLFASFCLIAYVVVRRHYGVVVSLLIALLAISAPLVTIHATEPYADFPVAVYYVLGLIYMVRYFESPTQQRYATMAGLCLAIAVFVKLEAMIFVGLAVFSFCLWIIRHRDGRTMSMLRPAFSFIWPFVILIPYFVFKAWYHIGFSQSYNEPVSDGIVPLDQLRIFPLIFSYLFLPDNINVIATAGLPLLFYMYWKRQMPFSHEAQHILIPVAAYILFFLCLYTFSVPHKYFLESATIFYRNMMTIYPGALFLTFILFKSFTSATTPDSGRHIHSPAQDIPE